MQKEIKIINQPFYIAKIENGKYIFVYDGYAETLDGEVYLPVVTEDENQEIQVIGCKK